MAVQDRKLVADAAAWLGNVVTSVLIIFVNKLLMAKSGYNFQYATTLCALHYLSCSISMWATQGAGLVKKVKLPLQDLALFTATANMSIVTLNLSLMLNPVGFYQIAKLLIIPFVCLVEKFWLGRVFTRPVILSVCTVVAGVAIVTVTDLSLENNPLGVAIAGMSVVSSGMQQIFCRTMQQKHKLSSHELLSNTAPAQAWSLLFIGPFLDRYVTHKWVTDFEYNVPAMVCLFISCAFAVLVNITQFVCLGRFSAVSFQVLGHSKTVLVLLGGWLFFGDHVSGKQFCGILLAIFGMVLYGMASANAPPAPQMSAAKPKVAGDEEQPLLGAGISEANKPFKNGNRTPSPKKETI